MSCTVFQVDLLSRANHLNQILTGLYRLSRDKGLNIVINDCTDNPVYKYKKTALVLTYKGKKLVYDMSDGYQSIDAMKYLMSESNYYFKRSFSDELNTRYGLGRIYPLGLNYDVTYGKNPLTRSRRFGSIRTFFEILSGNLITPEFVEGVPDHKSKDDIKIMFTARLWPRETTLTAEENDERDFINQERILLIRNLQKEFGRSFIGGFNDCDISRRMAQDLILPNRLTKRSEYIRTMKTADICIGTMGLHQSTGFKMGEYVAASRAIVCEKMKYTVPGDFANQKNYLEFTNIDECISGVESLFSNEEALFAMKCANNKYYNEYLKPEVLVNNSLITAGLEEVE